ncbi:hypothetical protein ElyMa_005296400 [Elysia marginata]|uniref:Uncharacterized protein n=1 Tax=Elysia marginata TaxID=1093978 RepID=A0AAV4JYE7_9GAST|nr:hypothetical protein ElyMa_005296400 [Elysia marginata]
MSMTCRGFDPRQPLSSDRLEGPSNPFSFHVLPFPYSPSTKSWDPRVLSGDNRKPLGTSDQPLVPSDGRNCGLAASQCLDPQIKGRFVTEPGTLADSPRGLASVA